MLERELKSNTEVVSQHTGRILEIIADQGTLIGAGDAIVTLDLMGRTVKELEVVLYVPSSYGKQIQVGMTAYVSPSTVKREEFGLMVGRVTYVSDYPSTSRGMLRILKNDKLLTSLVGTDSPYEVHADLLVDEHTFSGYRWSSSQGRRSRSRAVRARPRTSRSPAGDRSRWSSHSCASTRGSEQP